MTVQPLDIGVGVAFCVLGLTLMRRPDRMPAVLMVATGIAWSVGSVAWPLTFAYRGPLVQLLISYPGRRLHGRIARGVVAVGYLDGLIYPLGRDDVATVALSALVVGVAGHRHRTAVGVTRRARLTASVVAGALAGCLAFGAVARTIGHPLDDAVLVAFDVLMIAAALILFGDLRWARWTRATIANLAIDLGGVEGTAPLRDQLAAALGDPSLQIAYPDPDRSRLVDETGRLIEPVDGTAERVTTVVRDGAQEIAFLVHDRVVLDDPVLLTSVASLARVAWANARLQADIDATAAEIEASRRRLLTIADAERRELETELRSGALARLARVVRLLEEDAGHPDLVEQSLACQHTVVRFARGLHPHVLTEDGLAAALGELITGSQCPIELDVPPDRFPEEIEVVAYYVCAEALTNIARHAAATRAQVRIRIMSDTLLIEVSDDGVGGARLGTGSGLAGLLDRLDVHRGTLTIESPPGRGTRLRAAVPLSARQRVSR